MIQTTKAQRAAKLSPAIIVAAAIAMVESRGLAGLSTRKLAAALGCEAMSLYHHYRNMNDLLDAVVDALLADLAVDGKEWAPAQRLRLAALRYLALANTYPNAFQLVATRRWRTPNALAAVRSMVDMFVETGLPPPAALASSRILAAYLNGAGLALAAWRKSDGIVTVEAADTLADVAPSALAATSVKQDLFVGLDFVIAAVLKK